MGADSFKYVLIALFIASTYFLSLIGMRKTRSLSGFSIGNGDMSPYLVGITMAASIASTATFVINPGFVYVHGLSAYLHYGPSAFLGMTVALLLLSRGFRRIGAETAALTLPHWIFLRYGSRPLSLFFAFANLLSIAFVVLILVGCAILCSSLFGLSQKMALVLVMLFVFSYVLMGGAYAHAYTNCLQGILMAAIALLLFFTGFHYFEGDLLAGLASQGSAYAAVFNPQSPLYNDFFSVMASSFLITFALMMQPHILTKVLYLRKDGDLGRFLFTTLTIAAVFSLVLFVGFYARLKGMEIPEQDQVVVRYIGSEFSSSVAGKMVLAFISVALLAAGMSTLDGILVALSSMVVNDIFLPFRSAKPSASQSASQSQGLLLSRLVLMAIGLVSLALAWDPPRLVGLFAQKGVYGLAVACVVPVTLGVLLPRQPAPWLMGVAAAIALGGHFLLQRYAGMQNPSVSASYAMLASFVVALLTWFFLPAARLSARASGVDRGPCPASRR
jgi:SSS family solute:Na+ symporter/sodium/pantothenate symporter